MQPSRAFGSAQCNPKLRPGSVCIDVMARKRGRSGRKKKEIDSDLIKSIPLVNRKNVRALAAGMSLSASTIHRVIKDGRIKRHSNAIKPFLTDENQIERLRFLGTFAEFEVSDD